MQCLAALTREDIDKAHGQNRWMDFGVSSVRNLRRYVNLSRHRFSSKGLGFQSSYLTSEPLQDLHRDSPDDPSLIKLISKLFDQDLALKDDLMVLLASVLCPIAPYM